MSHDLNLRKRLDPDIAEKRVVALFNAGVTSPSEIARQMGWTGENARITANRYLNRAVEHGTLSKTDTGRIEQPEEVKARRDFIKTGRDSFIQTYPFVKKWYQNLSTRNKGKPVSTRESHISNLFKICDLLQVAPDTIASPSVNVDTNETRTPIETLTHYAEIFSIEFAKESSAFPDEYIKSMCDFATTAMGVVVPRGIGGILSRKKRNYGAYADIVKISDTKRDDVIRYALANYPEEIGVAVALALEVVTPRSEAFRNLQVSQVRFTQKFGCEVVDFDVFEPKTEASFPKRAIDPRIVRLVKNYVAGKKGYLFGGNKPLNEERLAHVLRDCYQHIGIDTEIPHAEGLINYWGEKPIHATRHTTTDLWVRRLGFNYSMVSLMGWKTQDIPAQVYAKNSLAYLDGAGRCDNPSCQRDHGAPGEDQVFCSMKCAILGNYALHGGESF